MKIPQDSAPQLEILSPDPAPSTLEIPCSGSEVKAGFPSPAEDFMPRSLDLNKELIRHPASTFFARVSGDSMSGAGISDGDLLVIDRAVEPYDMCIAVAFVEGEFTLKYISLTPDGITLLPANPRFRPIHIGADDQFTVWGVVRYVIKKV